MLARIQKCSPVVYRCSPVSPRQTLMMFLMSACSFTLKNVARLSKNVAGLSKNVRWLCKNVRPGCCKNVGVHLKMSAGRLKMFAGTAPSFPLAKFCLRRAVPCQALSYTYQQNHTHQNRYLSATNPFHPKRVPMESFVSRAHPIHRQNDCLEIAFP